MDIAELFARLPRELQNIVLGDFSQYELDRVEDSVLFSAFRQNHGFSAKHRYEALYLKIEYNDIYEFTDQTYFGLMRKLLETEKEVAPKYDSLKEAMKNTNLDIRKCLFDLGVPMTLLNGSSEDHIRKANLIIKCRPTFGEETLGYVLEQICRTGQPSLVRLLLENGANVNGGPDDDNLQYDFTRLPLERAYINEDIETVKILLEYKSQIKDMDVPEFEDIDWDIRFTPKRVEIFRLILEAYPDKDFGYHINRCLYEACSNHQIEAVKTCLKYIKDLGKDAKEFIVTAYADEGSIDIIRLLLEKGVTVDDQLLSEVSKYGSHKEIDDLLKQYIRK